MADYNNNRRGGDRGFNRGGFRGRGSDRPQQMHPAICANCGKECQVPFRPTSDRPVYCSECFEKNSRNSDNRTENRYQDRRNDRPSNFNRNRNDRFSSEEKEMFEAICDNCGKTCQVPFKPRGDKPIYCSDCFEKKGNSHSESPRSNSNIDQQIATLNTKLDRILQILDSSAVSEPEVIESEEVSEPESQEEPAKKRSSKKSS